MQREDVFLEDLDISLLKINRALRHIVGDEAAIIMMERLLIELDRLCNLRLTSR